MAGDLRPIWNRCDSATGEISGVIGMARERLARRGSGRAEKQGCGRRPRGELPGVGREQRRPARLGVRRKELVLYANPAISRLLGYTSQELARSASL